MNRQNRVECPNYVTYNIHTQTNTEIHMFNICMEQ